MNYTAVSIPPTTETGKANLYHLKRLWFKLINNETKNFPEERDVDDAIINLLGLGLLPTYQFIYANKPSFEEFENWVLSHHNHQIPPLLIHQCNSLVTGDHIEQEVSMEEMVLTEDDLAHWNTYGYVIVRNGISREEAAATCNVIWQHLEMDANNAETWYKESSQIQGIMVTLFNHPAIIKNRQSKRIRRAYEQLWGTSNLIVTADKVGFNPPVNALHKYRGAGVHWDVSLAQPIPFGTQGILYLTDTAANQGALRVLPGFHLQLIDWLNSLPKDTNPRHANFEQMGMQCIAANAGDFIIWNHYLPHDASPNTSTKPRLVQYFNWFNPSVKQILNGYNASVISPSYPLTLSLNIFLIST